jgi:hypothetical protein
MDRQVDTDELERELRATLAARREVGPNYDDHLIEAFMQKLNQQLVVATSHQPEQRQMPAQDGRRRRGAALSLLAMSILASVGFLFTVAGIIGAALALQAARGQAEALAGGSLGLAGSIGALLACVGIFVICIVTLAASARRGHWRMRARR